MNRKTIIIIVVAIVLLFIIYKVIKQVKLNMLLSDLTGVPGQGITTQTGITVSVSDEYIANLARDTQKHIEGITLENSYDLLIKSLALSDYDLARLVIQYRKLTARSLAQDWAEEFMFSYTNKKLRDQLVARINALNLP